MKAAKSRFNRRRCRQRTSKVVLAEGVSTKITLPQKVLKRRFVGAIRHGAAGYSLLPERFVVVSGGDKITVVATDGHRPRWRARRIDRRNAREIPPRKTILELSKLVRQRRSPMNCRRRRRASPSAARSHLQAVDGKFPITPVIPTTHNKKLLLNRFSCCKPRNAPRYHQ